MSTCPGRGVGNLGGALPVRSVRRRHGTLAAEHPARTGPGNIRARRGHVPTEAEDALL